METAASGAMIVADEGDAFGLMDRLDNQLLDPSNAARMVAGLRPDTLVYMVPVGGGKPPLIGLSATGAQVLAVRRGQFETLDITTVPVDIPVTVRGPDGDMEETVAGVRAQVRVRDGRSGTIFAGIDDEPLYIMLRDGGKKPDPKASVKAVNKAERNALRKHFAAIEDVVIEFARQAQNQGKAFVTAEPQAAQKPRSGARVESVLVATPDEVAAMNDARKAANITGQEFSGWLGRQGINPNAIPANRVAEVMSYIANNAKDAPAPDAPQDPETLLDEE